MNINEAPLEDEPDTMNNKKEFDPEEAVFLVTFQLPL